MKRTVQSVAALLTFPLLLTGACTTEGEGESVEMSTAALLTQVDLVPTSATASGISGTGCSSPYWACVDDGTAYSKADDGSTVAEVSSATPGTHTLGFSGGPTGTVAKVTSHVRTSTSASTTKGTIQVKLYDGTTLVGTGAAHSVSNTWANFDDTFSGLSAANVNSLKAAVLLTRTAGTGKLGYTMLWITATGAPTCTPGAKQCTTGQQPQTCDANGAWQNTGSPCPYLCNAGICTGVCTPGAKQCSGLQPQTCDANGAWQNTGSPCPYVCAPTTGLCTGVCAPGAKRCNGLQPQTCDSTGTWQNSGSPCPTACDANTGTCTGACTCTGGCTPGAKQCNGLQPQTCDANGVWQNNGSLCQYFCDGSTATCVNTCSCATCTPGQKKCSGSQPQTCDANGNWQNTGSACTGCSTCSVGACVPAPNGTSCGSDLCSPMICQAGVCTPGSPVSCNSPPACHIGPGTCNPSNGQCTYQSLPNNTSCSSDACNPKSCQAGVCTPGTPVSCSSPPACYSGPGTCNPSTGQCTYTPLSCNTPPDACHTSPGSCSGGTCNYPAITCVPTPCHNAGTCSGGVCSQGPAKTGVQDSLCPAGQQWCYSGTCVQCVSDANCSGSTPKCNTSTHTCMACRPQKSATNVVNNGGFDTGMSYWLPNGSDWQSGSSDPASDRNGCPDSGSAGGAFLWYAPNQCVQVSPYVSYWFGASIWVNASSDGSYCEMTYHGLSDCSDTPLEGRVYDIGPGLSGLTPGWNDYAVSTGMSPFDAVAAYIWCASEDRPIRIDQVYLNTTKSY